MQGISGSTIILVPISFEPTCLGCLPLLLLLLPVARRSHNSLVRTGWMDAHDGSSGATIASPFLALGVLAHLSPLFPCPRSWGLLLVRRIASMGVCNWQQAVEEVPQSLVRELEGNDSMRSKFEALCRKAQNDICKRIEELDGEGKVS